MKIKRYVFIFLFIIICLFSSNEAYGYSYGVGKIVNNERPDIGSYKNIIEKYNGYYIGKDDKSIYLTFDCGYENGYTSKILDTLKEEEVKACFFITGHYLNSALDLVKRMTNEGHIIGNHTNKHKHFTKESDVEILEDVRSLEEMYEAKFNQKMSSFVRPPAGEFSEDSQKLLSANSYTSVFWSLAYVDWNKDTYYGNNYSYNNVMSRIHNGAIILMHTVSKDNSTDLKKIICDLKMNGYEFKSLYEL